MKLQMKFGIHHILALLLFGQVAALQFSGEAYGQYRYGQQYPYPAGRVVREEIVSDVPLSEMQGLPGINQQPTPAAPGNVSAVSYPSGGGGSYAAAPYQEIGYTAYSGPTGEPLPASDAVPLTEGYDYSHYLRRPAISPAPDYPRHGYSPMLVTRGLSSDEHPSVTQHPETREDILPERVGGNPPLKPYPEQETYSYFTDTTTSVSPMCQMCGEGYGNPALWQIKLNIAVLHRTAGKMDTFSVFNSMNAPVDPQSSYTVAPGLDFTLTKYLGRDVRNFDIWLDMRFDGLFHWNSRTMLVDNALYANSLLSIVPGIGAAYGPPYPISGGTTNWYYPNIYIMKYDSTYNSGELLFRFKKRGRPDALVGHPNGRWTRECQQGLSYTHVAGIRYVDFGESLDWTGNCYVNINEDPLATGNVSLKVDNHLLGVIVGGELTDKRCMWSFGLKWRAMSFMNMMKTDLVARSTQPFDTGGGELYRYPSMTNKNDIAYQLEGGIFVNFKVRPHFTLRLSYDFSYLDRVALVENNMEMDLYGKTGINNGNNVFLQCLTFGGTFNW